MSPMLKFLEALRTNRASDAELVAVAMLLAGLVIFLILRLRWHDRAMGSAQKRHARRDFLRLCRDRGLGQEETRLLTQAGIAFQEPLQTGLIESNVSFDRLARRIINEAYAPEIPRLNFTLGCIRQKLGFRPPPRGWTLNSTRELPAGQRLYLVFQEHLFLEGIISEVDEIKIVVHLLAGAATPIPHVSNDPVRLHFNRPGDARYSGECFVLKVQSEAEGLFVVLSHAEELKRDQRRQDFRVDERRRVYVWVVNQFAEPPLDVRQIVARNNAEEAILEDLSGGGASLIFNRELPAHQRLYLDLNENSQDELPLMWGSVIRSQRRSGRANWAISLRFEDLRPSERQKLVHHVFTQERDIVRTA